MEGRTFAPKVDPEHEDVAPPSDTDSEYRRIRVYEAAGRTDYADRIRRGQAIAPAAPSCAEFTALAAPSFQTLRNREESAEYERVLLPEGLIPGLPIGTEVLQPIDSRLQECLYCKFWIRPGKGDTSGKYHKFCATRKCEVQSDTHVDRVRLRKRIRDYVADQIDSAPKPKNKPSRRHYPHQGTNRRC